MNILYDLNQLCIQVVFTVKILTCIFTFFIILGLIADLWCKPPGNLICKIGKNTTDDLTDDEFNNKKKHN